MLTIFTIPKPFEGHIEVIQRNAIASWTRLHPDCEVVLCGNEIGIEEIAGDYKTKWIPDLKLTNYGTPLLSSAFEQVSKIAKNDILCYVNADIILMKDLIAATKRVKFSNFLMMGRRWDIDITELLNFEQDNWDENLRKEVTSRATLKGPGSIDYFVFPKSSELLELPPFAVGRPFWDNWFIYRARQLQLPVIDATKAVTIVHQNHDYSHVPKKQGNTSRGPEANYNHGLIGSPDHIFYIFDATHIITPNALSPALEEEYLKRRWQRLPMLHPEIKFILPVLTVFKEFYVFVRQFFKF